jgi:hypothetical protein
MQPIRCWPFGIHVIAVTVPADPFRLVLLLVVGVVRVDKRVAARDVAAAKLVLLQHIVVQVVLERFWRGCRRCSCWIRRGGG